MVTKAQRNRVSKAALAAIDTAISQAAIEYCRDKKSDPENDRLNEMFAQRMCARICASKLSAVPHGFLKAYGHLIEARNLIAAGMNRQPAPYDPDDSLSQDQIDRIERHFAERQAAESKLLAQYPALAVTASIGEANTTRSRRPGRAGKTNVVATAARCRPVCAVELPNKRSPQPSA